MMKSLYTFILLLCFCGICLAQQEVPQALYNAIYSYLNDGKTVKQDIRVLELDTTIQASEITFERPIEIYTFKLCENDYCFKNASVDTPVMSLIKQAGAWKVFFKARGSYLYHAEFRFRDGTFHWSRSGGHINFWTELKKEYPESTGIYPILIVNRNNYYLHFPQISEHNLTLLTDSAYRTNERKQLLAIREMKEKVGKEHKEKIEREYKNKEGVLTTMTDSYKKLVDSRMTLSYLKNRKKWENKWPEMKRGVE